MYRKLFVCFVWLVGSGFHALNERKPTVFLIGDSTVAPFEEHYAPMTGWGQTLPEFFTDEITVDNRAIAGKSSRSFIEEGKWARVLRDIGEGDYLFIQFGHNDQKRDHRYSSPYTTYKGFLTTYINETRHKGGIPILVTSVMRRRFRNGRLYDTHGNYPEAVRQVADELAVPLVDLHQRSFTHFDELGEEATKEIFLWLKPGEEQNYSRGLEDNTHFSRYGAREVGTLVVDELETLDISLKNYLKDYYLPREEEVAETITLCQGDSVQIGNRFRATAGEYRAVYQNRQGCDSTVITQLIIRPTREKQISWSICQGDSIKMGNRFFSEAGQYRQAYKTRHGCDSTVITTLSIIPIRFHERSMMIAEGDSVRVGGQYRHRTGTYYDTLSSTLGCDSIIATALRVIPSPVNTRQTIALCEGDSLLVRGSYQNNSGVFYDTLSSSLGGDSIIITTLLVSDSIATPTVVATQNTLHSSVTGDTYQWFFNGQASEATTAVLIPSQEGHYSVVVRVGQCTSLPSPTYYYAPVVTGAHDLLPDQIPLQVYRGETGSFLTVIVPPTLGRSATVHIHNLLGNCIYRSSSPDSSVLRIPFDQPKGVYIVTLAEPERRRSIKFYW